MLDIAGYCWAWWKMLEKTSVIIQHFLPSIQQYPAFFQPVPTKFRWILLGFNQIPTKSSKNVGFGEFWLVQVGFGEFWWGSGGVWWVLVVSGGVWCLVWPHERHDFIFYVLHCTSHPSWLYLYHTELHCFMSIKLFILCINPVTLRHESSWVNNSVLTSHFHYDSLVNYPRPLQCLHIHLFPNILLPLKAGDVCAGLTTANVWSNHKGKTNRYLNLLPCSMLCWILQSFNTAQQNAVFTIRKLS